MTNRMIGPRSALATALLASVVLALPAGSVASSAKTQPHGATKRASHLRGSTGLLTGVIFPQGVATGYYFQYGPTVAYGSQTPTAAAGSGTAKVTVGQPVTGLTPGATYHFRLVLVIGATTVPELDKTFVAGGTPSNRLVFKIAKSKTADVYGTPFLIGGTLSGIASANAPIALQASPYPYLEPFVNVGAPGTTNAAGAFSFRISNLQMSTQFRIVTMGLLPVYSPILTEQVALKVSLRVSTTKRRGVVRLSGEVSPSKVGIPVEIQLQKASRPSGKSENTARYVPAFKTKLKRGGRTSSRFSVVVEIRHAGRYRAIVKLGKGPLVSGTSNSIVIHNVANGRAHRKSKTG